MPPPPLGSSVGDAPGSIEHCPLLPHLLGLRCTQRAVRPECGGLEGLLRGVLLAERERWGKSSNVESPQDCSWGQAPGACAPPLWGWPHPRSSYERSKTRPLGDEDQTPDSHCSPTGAPGPSLAVVEATSEAGAPQGGTSSQDVHTEHPLPEARGPVPDTWDPRLPKPPPAPHTPCQRVSLPHPRGRS